MQEFFTAESEEASKVSQNKDDLKLLFYGKNIYFYSLKFAKVHRKMAIDSFYRCGSQILSESENFPPLGFFSSNNHSIKILRGDICHPVSPVSSLTATQLNLICDHILFLVSGHKKTTD